MTITLVSALVGLAVYLLALLWLGARSITTGSSADSYFLADRRLRAGLLFFTLIATNFSAFFFLGFAGAGYRIGISYYPMMAFGTGLAALSFGSLGCRVRRLSRDHGLITPSELMGYLLPGEGPRLLVLLVMVLFTLPYLALQPLGAGYLLESLTGGAVPFELGALLLTLVIVVYVVGGGMRAVARTDVLQGVLMFVLMLLAFAAVAHGVGGVAQANRTLMQQQPALFSGAGLDGFFTPRMLASYLLLWPLCLPMFPQMMMRFFAAADDRSLKQSMVLYPVVAGVLFICPVLIGVWGHLAFPGLVGRAADQIMPLMLGRYSPQWLTGLAMVGALAAFMSTLDSQLLALSSMLTRDLYSRYWRPQASLPEQVRVGQVLVVALAAGGLVIALRPPEAILTLATHAFSGLALLAPMLVGAVYGLRWSSTGAVLSVLAGEVLLLALAMGWLPPAFTFGCLPLIPALLLSCAVLAVDVVVSRMQRALS
jgi:SSS family solute:Na+ symporter